MDYEILVEWPEDNSGSWEIGIIVNDQKVGSATGKIRGDWRELDTNKSWVYLECWFVEPDYRRSDFQFGDKLLSELERLAKKSNVTRIEGSFGCYPEEAGINSMENHILIEEDTANKIRAYKRNGYIISGESFVKVFSNS